MGKTIHTETDPDATQQRQGDADAYATKGQVLEIARAGAVRWAGLLERLAK